METWICGACHGEVAHMGFLGMREHGRCNACGLDQSRIDPEDQILRDEEGLTPEELADGQAQFDATFPILTRPGESLIDTVRAARQAEEGDEFEAYNNDMK